MECGEVVEGGREGRERWGTGRCLGMSTTARDRACSASSGSSNSVRVRSPNVVPRLFRMAVALSRRSDERRVLRKERHVRRANARRSWSLPARFLAELHVNDGGCCEADHGLHSVLARCHFGLSPDALATRLGLGLYFPLFYAAQRAKLRAVRSTRGTVQSSDG